MYIFLIKLVQFLISISLLVLLHEGGHFLFAKLFKTRVDKFYMFFNPRFSIMRIKKFGGKLHCRFFAANTPAAITEDLDEDGNKQLDANGNVVYRSMTDEEREQLPEDDWRRNPDNTEFGIGWMPVGGYCSIIGMVDETKSTKDLASVPQPWEYRSKPIWQRFLIIVGGVTVNFLLALFIYSMIMMHWGDSYCALKDMKLGMEFSPTAKNIGFQDGDLPIKIDGKEYIKYDIDLLRGLADADNVTVLRNGKEVDIAMPDDIDLLKIASEVPPFIRVKVPAIVDSVIVGTPADKVGMKKGDVITAINGTEVSSWGEVTDITSRLADKLLDAKTASDSLACRQIAIAFTSADSVVQDTIILSEDMLMGVTQTHYSMYYKPREIKYGFFESFSAGIAYGCNVLKGYIGDLKYIFSSEGVKSLGGFGTIGNLFPATWDWYLFWKMTAFLSIILAFMNILPIPALDGGYALMLIYEAITRRKPSDKFMERAGTIGFVILVLLLVVANLNDVLRWLNIM